MFAIESRRIYVLLVLISFYVFSGYAERNVFSIKYFFVWNVLFADEINMTEECYKWFVDSKLLIPDTTSGYRMMIPYRSGMIVTRVITDQCSCVKM